MLFSGGEFNPLFCVYFSRGNAYKARFLLLIKKKRERKWEGFQWSSCVSLVRKLRIKFTHSGRWQRSKTAVPDCCYNYKQTPTGPCHMITSFTATFSPSLSYFSSSPRFFFIRAMNESEFDVNWPYGSKSARLCAIRSHDILYNLHISRCTLGLQASAGLRCTTSWGRGADEIPPSCILTLLAKN